MVLKAEVVRGMPKGDELGSAELTGPISFLPIRIKLYQVKSCQIMSSHVN